MSALAGIGLGIARGITSPIINAGVNQITFALGFNDLQRQRKLLYEKQADSTQRLVQAQLPGQAGPGLVVNANYAPTAFDLSTAIDAFNQLPWRFADENEGIKQQFWTQLAWQLSINGVDISLQEPFGVSPVTDAADAPEALLWTRYIDMTSASASFADVQRGYWRSTVMADADKSVDLNELHFNLQRAKLRRKQDRSTVLSPFVPWSGGDAFRLRWMDLIDDAELEALLRAAGIHHGDDRDWSEIFARRVPDIATLQGWSVRRLWDDGIAQQYGLDGGRDESPVAQFFMRTLGARGQQPALPNQPEGNANWTALGYRATRPLPNFGAAAIMQHRLRPLPDEPGQSVVEGTAPWTRDNTIDMLRVAGYSEPIIDRFMGLVYEPLNIRLINHVLTPMATHPDVAKAAEENLGHPTQWIEAAMLDHGFAPPLAKVAAAGILAQADDRANAEKIEHQRRLRQLRRDAVIHRWQIGLIDYVTATDAMTDEFFTLGMAQDELNTLTMRLEAMPKEAGIKALHEAWITGKMSADDISASLTQLGVIDVRKELYLSEWIWERTEKTRMLSTGEILSALKAGLMPATTAQLRLVNLGWSAPDALIEVAQVEQSLQLAAAKTQAATATHLQAQADKAHAEQTKEAKAAALAAAKAHQENIKVEKEVDLAAHEKLLAQSEYYAKVHTENDAYAKAEAKGNKEKMAAEISKELAAYQKYLLEQLRLVQQSPEVFHAIGPIDTSIASGPSQAARSGAPPAKA